MQFSLEFTFEQQEFTREVRTWLEDNVPRNLKLKWDPAKLTYEQYLELRKLGRKLGEKGWFVPTAPLEYGGGGLSLDKAIIIEMELYSFLGLGLPPYYDVGSRLVAPAVLAWGTEEQKTHFLPPILKGEVATWQLFTEPEAGSDLANVKTMAIRHGDKFIINGQKIFVGGLYKAEQFWLLACTDAKALRHANLGMFILPSNLSGITITPLDLIGDNRVEVSSGGVKNQVFLDDVEVSDFYLIGGEGKGWRVANTTLEVEHGGAGAIRPNRLVQTFLDFCRTDRNTRSRLKVAPELLEDVISIYISANIERLLALRNYWLSHTERPRSYEGPQYSLWRKTQGIKLASTILNVLGPQSLLSDSEWAQEGGCFECQQRCGIVTSAGGTREVQKLAMARAIGIGRSPTIRDKAET